MTMLRNIEKCLMVPLVGLCCAMAFSPRAVAADKPGLKLKKKSQPQAEDSKALPVRVWKRTRSFQRLERAILAGVKLEATQRRKVQETFESLYRLMRDDPTKASFYPQTYRAYKPAELQERKDDLKRAKKAGNTKLAKEIQLDIDKHTVGSEANLTSIPEDIIRDLAPLMNAHQIADYQRVTARWTALKVRGPAEGPLRMLIRVLKDPEMKLETEQRLAAERILGEAVVAMRKNHEPDNIAKLAASAREEMTKVLESEQRARMDKTLRMFAAEFKAIRNYANEWHGKRGRAAPDHYAQPIPWEE